MIGARWLPVLVRGIGDVGSIVAAALFHGGDAVALNGEHAGATPRINGAHAQVLTACGYPITEDELLARLCGMSDAEMLATIERR